MLCYLCVSMESSVLKKTNKTMFIYYPPKVCATLKRKPVFILFLCQFKKKGGGEEKRKQIISQPLTVEALKETFLSRSYLNQTKPTPLNPKQTKNPQTTKTPNKSVQPHPRTRASIIHRSLSSSLPLPNTVKYSASWNRTTPSSFLNLTCNWGGISTNPQDPCSAWYH